VEKADAWIHHGETKERKRRRKAYPLAQARGRTENRKNQNCTQEPTAFGHSSDPTASPKADCAAHGRRAAASCTAVEGKGGTIDL
jgi:hypothetical protein